MSLLKFKILLFWLFVLAFECTIDIEVVLKYVLIIILLFSQTSIKMKLLTLECTNNLIKREPFNVSL